MTIEKRGKVRLRWPLMMIVGAEEQKGKVSEEICMGASDHFHFTGIRFVRKQG